MFVFTTGTLTRNYQYDAAGNTLSDGARRFTYNGAGRLTSATRAGVTTNYMYNALGQRIQKANATGSILFAYDEQGHLIGEYDQNGLVQELVWLGDIPVATLRTDQGGTNTGLFYIHTDHLNAPTKITRTTNNEVIWRWDHDAYGNGTPNEDPDGNGLQLAMNLRFPGQYQDQESGLYYNDNRYYDATTGRYISSDPIGLIGGSFSTYSYVDNNPIGLVDEDGLTGHAPGKGGAMVPILRRTYAEMKEKNVPGTDQFFHCLAACRAVKETGLKDSIRQVMNWKENYHDYPLGRMGLYGQLGRFYSHKEMVTDNNADKAANEQGLQCLPGQTCEQNCSSLLDNLPVKYRPFMTKYRTKW